MYCDVCQQVLHLLASWDDAAQGGSGVGLNYNTQAGSNTRPAAHAEGLHVVVPFQAPAKAAAAPALQQAERTADGDAAAPLTSDLTVLLAVSVTTTVARYLQVGQVSTIAGRDEPCCNDAGLMSN